jgi:hypothetical protein
MRKISVVLLLATRTAVFAQYEQQARNAFISNDIRQGFDYWNITQPGTKFHSSFQPYLSSTYQNARDTSLPFKSYSFNNMFLSRTYNERPEKRNWFNLQLHPIIEAEAGYDMLEARVTSASSGGLHIKLNINDDFTFAGTVVGGNYQLPFFLDTTVGKQWIIPEFGQAYKDHRNSGYNFFDYQGYVSYSPRNNKVFNFQLGRDKHFIGDGHRSVLLSDFAPAYPFFRINTNIWRLQYNVWYAWMYDVTNASRVKDNFRNKFGTFHYLSCNILKELNVAIFENVVWRGTDTNQVRNFDVNYLNPVIFFRPVEYSVGSPDNSFLGINVNGTLFRKFKLFAQLGLDEFFLREIRARRGWWANKQAWQIGLKYINAFNIKGLMLTAEFNQVRPYTYTHGVVDQNYGHYGVPLAHPLGANFRELIGSLTYREGKAGFNARLMYAVSGRDSARSSNVGQNIFLSYTTRPKEYGHYTTQGIRTVILNFHFRYYYLLVPNLNLRLEAGYVQRSESSTAGYKLVNPYFYLGITSSIWNSYRDY